MNWVLELSKTDELLLAGLGNLDFDGEIKKYLSSAFSSGKSGFLMIRAKMFPTKGNFKGRWDCCKPESDKHLFAYPVFKDLLNGVEYDKFMSFH